MVKLLIPQWVIKLNLWQKHYFKRNHGGGGHVKNDEITEKTECNNVNEIL